MISFYNAISGLMAAYCKARKIWLQLFLESWQQCQSARNKHIFKFSLRKKCSSQVQGQFLLFLFSIAKCCFDAIRGIFCNPWTFQKLRASKKLSNCSERAYNNDCRWLSKFVDIALGREKTLSHAINYHHTLEAYYLKLHLLRI